MGKRRRTIGLAAVIALAACAPWRSVGQETGLFGNRLLPAPQFPAGAQWLNTDHPLTLNELRGKLVLIDFWTYCCINCMHIMPELKKLEHQFPDDLVVIGVHSAKFTAEGDAENIRQAVLRYQLEHPVLVDSQMRYWDACGTNSWPTIFLLDTQGRLLLRYGGEITAASMAPLIEKARDAARRDGSLKPSPVHWLLERDKQPVTVLSYPGKVLADEAGGRLFIADSTHQRYLVCGLDGVVREVIGGGQEGFTDGDFATARFRKPQGMALLGEKLYLADTENHAVRVADLTTKRVSTLVGNGVKPARLNVAGRGASIGLASPWDIAVHDGLLYVAVAGTHQIWRVDPNTGEAAPFAGSGREDIADGPAFVPAANAIGADTGRGAALAQTSGLSVHGDQLYFADSETSSLRVVNLTGEPRVRTLIGHGLFDFGDIDGDARTARLQHCLGVVWANDALFVADTYNNKIRRLDLASGRLTTFAGTGHDGHDDGPLAQASFSEPGGLSFAGGKLYVADTNNHAIRVIDPAAGTVATLALGDLDRAAPAMTDEAGAFRGRIVTLPAQTVAPGPARLVIAVTPLAGWHLNPLAPLNLRLRSDNQAVVADGQQRLTAAASPLAAPLTLAAGHAELLADVAAYFCTESGSGACVLDAVRFKIPLTVAEGGADRVDLSLKQER
jgi:thiol-disulfide isomerase/thioredoxin/DNA-binding beta-propeller fold protein YncE